MKVTQAAAVLLASRPATRFGLQEHLKINMVRVTARPLPIPPPIHFYWECWATWILRAAALGWWVQLEAIPATPGFTFVQQTDIWTRQHIRPGTARVLPTVIWARPLTNKTLEEVSTAPLKYSGSQPTSTAALARPVPLYFWMKILPRWTMVSSTFLKASIPMPCPWLRISLRSTTETQPLLPLPTVMPSFT